MNIRQKIKDFIEKETQQTIEDDDKDLIKSGRLDSFSMIKLIGFIEEELGVKVNMEELTPKNFNSLENIVRKIKSWQK